MRESRAKGRTDGDEKENDRRRERGSRAEGERGSRVDKYKKK